MSQSPSLPRFFSHRMMAEYFIALLHLVSGFPQEGKGSLYHLEQSLVNSRYLMRSCRMSKWLGDGIGGRSFICSFSVAVITNSDLKENEFSWAYGSRGKAHNVRET